MVQLVSGAPAVGSIPKRGPLVVNALVARLSSGVVDLEDTTVYTTTLTLNHIHQTSITTRTDLHIKVDSSLSYDHDRIR